MGLLLDSFYQEHARLAEKEQLLQEEITKRQTLIDNNEQKYKEYLRTGKEDKADKLFEEQQSLKQKNLSDTKKLSELRPIHWELLQEQALSVLDNDLIILMKKETAEALKIVQEESDLNKRLRVLQSDRMQKESEINSLFGKYDRLAEKMKLKELHRGRFGKEPYNFLSYSGSKAFSEARRKVK